MTPDQIIEKILLGGLLGLLGQGIRMAIGLKKLSDANAQKQEQEDLNGGRLMISLFIGFVAGALYVLVNGFENQSSESSTSYVGNQFIFTVIAAGYAGSDFIEGLFNTYIAKMPTANTGSGNTIVAVNPVVATTADTAVVMPVNPVPTDTPEPPAENDDTATGTNQS